MTTIPCPTPSPQRIVRPTFSRLDRLAIAAGTALAIWGTRRAALRAVTRSVPGFPEQSERFATHRHELLKAVSVIQR